MKIHAAAKNYQPVLTAFFSRTWFTLRLNSPQWRIQTLNAYCNSKTLRSRSSPSNPSKKGDEMKTFSISATGGAAESEGGCSGRTSIEDLALRHHLGKPSFPRYPLRPEPRPKLFDRSRRRNSVKNVMPDQNVM